MAEVKNPKPISRAELKKQIIAKAAADPQFKQELSEDPHKVLASYGIKVPDNVKIHVLTETDKDYYFVVPGLKNEISGGICWNNSWGMINELNCPPEPY